VVHEIDGAGEGDEDDGHDTAETEEIFASVGQRGAEQRDRFVIT